MNITWKNIKEYIYIATIILSVGYHFIDEAKESTTVDMTIQHQDEKLDEILETLSDHEKYWLEQMAFNGSVNEYIRLDIK